MYRLMFCIVYMYFVLCDACVPYNFEEDYYEKFTNTYGTCVGFLKWTLGTYKDIEIDPPHRFSEKFILSHSELSCVMSFSFQAEETGTIEINVYMDSTSTNDQLSIMVTEESAGGSVGNTFLGPSVTPGFSSGWHTLRISLGGSGEYSTYITLLGIAAPDSIVLVDSFRYIPPDYEGECEIYPDISQPPQEITTPPAQEITTPPPQEITTPPPQEITTPPPQEITTPPVIELTTPAPIELPTHPPLELTTAPSQENTTPPSQEITTPPPQEITTPPSQEITTPPPQEITTPPPQENTTPSLEEITTPPLEELTTPPSQENTTPPLEEPTTPPLEELTTPPSQENTTPPLVELTTPPSQENTTPPLEELTTPPPQENTTPPSQENTTSPPEEVTITPPTLEPTEPTERPIIVDSNKFWNSFTITMVILLVLILILVISSICFFIGLKRGRNKSPIILTDENDLPRTIIIPRVDKISNQMILPYME